MLTALSAMRDANMFAEEAAHGWEALVEEKKAAAVADFDEAINSWKVAKEVYLELIKDFPENPEYLNNLGNLIYNMAYNGLEADLEEAKDYLNKALAIAEKTRYTRNLELIEELKTSEKTAQTLADNIKLIEQIRAAK